jgi:NAD+ synthase (glutamine-hydrolysing)
VATIRLGLAQLNVTVGDMDANAAAILEALREGYAHGCDLVVAPELALVGYPPEDLLLKGGFIEDAAVALDKLAAASPACLGVLGTVLAGDAGIVELAEPTDAREEALEGEGTAQRGSANAAALVGAGRLHGAVAKRQLPNYGVFDERRWFAPGTGAPVVYAVGGAAVGIAICEDVWLEGGPAAALAAAGASLIVVLNASPFSRGRFEDRRTVLERRCAETGCAFAYVNLVGGQDELVFDGASFVLDATGRLVAAAPQFSPALLVCELELPDASGATSLAELSEPRATRAPIPAPTIAPRLDPTAEVYEALVLGTRDYLHKNGFSNAVIALSGGIDSTLVAAIAVDALGAECVLGVSMPSRYSSEHSRTDAFELARRLGIRCVSAPIESAHAALTSVLGGVLGSDPKGLTDENLQSRIRGVVLMGISNETGAIVLTTGNKSELATGYSTLYGDTAGGFAVVKDVVKTLLYELCRYRNECATTRGETPPIPESIISKPPSAELRPNQVDADSLPPYELLDPILIAYVEGDKTADELLAEGHDRALVERVVALVDAAEYKRRQMPPGVRITAKSFGKDRRLPITNRYGAPRRP